MDIRFLASLEAVIEQGSIAQAARSQQLTAAAVSQRIKALEASLKCPLLIRTGHSASPTAECLRLLPKLKQIAVLSNELKHELDPTGLSGELRVGVISTVLSGFFPQSIQTLSQLAPNILLKIVPGTSAQLYQALIEQKIDIAVLVEPPFSLIKALQFKPLFTEPLVFISQKEHPDINRALKSEPYLEYDKHAWGGAIAHQYLKDHQLKTTALCEIDALESIAFMVGQGMGVSLIPHWNGLDKLETLVITKVDASDYQRNIGVLTAQQSTRQPMIDKLCQVLFNQHQ